MDGYKPDPQVATSPLSPLFVLECKGQCLFLLILSYIKGNYREFWGTYWQGV